MTALFIAAIISAQDLGFYLNYEVVAAVLGFVAGFICGAFGLLAFLISIDR